MSEIESQQLLIARLAQLAPGGSMGRTALMKWFYFLQTLRAVPLPYRFTLYSYGPFDRDVLYDLAVAENLGLVKENVVLYPQGYGYQIRLAEGEETARALEQSDLLKKYADDIAWVMDRFGTSAAAQLELAATIIYTDRENHDNGASPTAESHAQAVAEVKPRFDRGTILHEIEALRNEELLIAVSG